MTDKLILKDNTMSYCLYVADPATFLASNYGLGNIFSSENSSFIQLQRKWIWRGLCSVGEEVQSLKFLFNTT